MLHKNISEFIFVKKYDMEIVTCSDDPSEIIDYIKNTKVNGLYFLDVEISGGYNGVEVAKAIRQHDPRGFIVFVTAHKRYMSLTFELKVEALAYVYKDDEDTVCGSVFECINDAYQKHVARSDDGCYIIKTHDGRQVSFLFDDILFFEKDQPGTNRVIVHTIKRNYSFYGTLDGISGTLPIGLFYRCHQSYIVNANNITERCRVALNQGAGNMMMPNGVVCQVSTRKIKGLIKLLDSAF